MGKYDLVLFDWDGTLADSWPWFTRTINEAALHFRFRQIDTAEGERLRSLQPREILSELGIRWWRVPSFTRYMRSRMSRDLHDIQLFEGTARLITRLADANVRLGIITTNSEPNVRNVLGERSASQIAAYACNISMFGKASRTKKVVAESGVSPAKAILIGDEIRDIEAALSAGIASGAVGWGYATPAVLRAAQPTEFFETMDDVAQIVAASGGR